MRLSDLDKINWGLQKLYNFVRFPPCYQINCHHHKMTQIFLNNSTRRFKWSSINFCIYSVLCAECFYWTTGSQFVATGKCNNWCNVDRYHLNGCIAVQLAMRCLRDPTGVKNNGKIVNAAGWHAFTHDFDKRSENIVSFALIRYFRIASSSSNRLESYSNFHNIAPLQQWRMKIQEHEYQCIIYLKSWCLQIHNIFSPLVYKSKIQFLSSTLSFCFLLQNS